MPDTAMTWGNFAPLAPKYSARPPHSAEVLKSIAALFPQGAEGIRLADVGSGTGNLLRSLSGINVSGYAVEPTLEMRQEAELQLAAEPIKARIEWVTGTAETTTLADKSVDWVLMGNLLQWIDQARAFTEAHRILRDGGLLTISWNVRDYDRDELQRGIEQKISDLVPDLYRTELTLEQIMEDAPLDGLFAQRLYIEQFYTAMIPASRFMDTWEGVNEIPSQVSKETWDRVLEAVRAAIPDRQTIETVWITQAWTYTKV